MAADTIAITTIMSPIVPTIGRLRGKSPIGIVITNIPATEQTAKTMTAARLPGTERMAIMISGKTVIIVPTLRRRP